MQVLSQIPVSTVINNFSDKVKYMAVEKPDFKSQIQLFLEICHYVWTHPEKENYLMLSTVSELDYYNFDGKKKKPQLNVTYTFLGKYERSRRNDTFARKRIFFA